MQLIFLICSVNIWFYPCLWNSEDEKKLLKFFQDVLTFCKYWSWLLIMSIQDNLKCVLNLSSNQISSSRLVVSCSIKESDEIPNPQWNVLMKFKFESLMPQKIRESQHCYPIITWQSFKMRGQSCFYQIKSLYF